MTPNPKPTSTISVMPGPLPGSDRRAELVGRTTEMRMLDDALAQVRATGESRAVTVLGASGVGKTRLVREFLIRASNAGHAGPPPGQPVRVFRGSARDQLAAYGLFARVLRARFGIVDVADVEEAKSRVRAAVATVLEDRKVGDVLYFLGQLLDLHFQDSPLIKAVEGDPHQVHLLRRAVIKRFWEEDAAHDQNETSTAPSPIILVFDDLHTAQEESLELLAYLVESLRAPILVICLARPELLVRRETWTQHGEGRHQSVELTPLSDGESADMMKDLLGPCGSDPAVDDLIDTACTLAGGNPALLEQVIRAFFEAKVLERRGAGEDEKWTIHPQRLSQARLPLTVEDAVQARIAALTQDERDLLERAATMGGVFWLGGLLATQRDTDTPPDVWSTSDVPDLIAVRETLEELTERDYVLRLPDSTFSDDEEYVFKHNLEREALVKMTPPASLRRYHAIIADWLGFKENVSAHEEHLGMLAMHREKAGARAPAAKAYLEAADVARERYSNAKAAEYYAKGLALLKEGAEGEAGQRMQSIHHYGDVLQALGRNDDALLAFREMLARAYRLDLRSKGGAAHSRIGRLYRETGRLDLATRHLGAALSLFESSNDERGIASAVDDIGKLFWLRGDYPRALESTQRALMMRKKIGDRRSIALSLNNLGLVYQDSGQFKPALEAFEQALQIRREIGDLVGVSVTLNNLGTVAQDQREDARALMLFDEAHEVAKETGDRNRIALILTNLGETNNRLGAVATAIQYLKQAEEIADEVGDKLGLAEALRGLGKAYLAQRDYDKARECTARAVEFFREVQSKVQVGVALRSLGEVTAAGTPSAASLMQARGHLLQSIAIFEEIGNEIELARSYRSYAELLKASPEFRVDPAVMKEVADFVRRADDISAKLKISSFGLRPEAFFGTR